jgi:threonyl-tRNA synthetase
MDKYKDFKSILPDWVSEENFELYKMRHTGEHVLHMAVSELYPEVRRAMGPPIEDGFYFDFDPNSVIITENDLPRIEEKMLEIQKRKLPLIRREITIEEGRKLFENNRYKLEWIEEFSSEGKNLSVYWTGDPDSYENADADLCKGPHVENTNDIGHFRLLSIAGAYWRGDEKNKMLTRIYATSFPSRKELEEHLKLLEEAKLRDHRKLGKELDLFVFSETIGKGLPLWTPRGSTIRRELERFIVDEEIKRGYLHVYTPDIARIQLYEKSGHYPYYKDSMYAPIEDEDEKFMLRPMTCPHHFELYLSKPRSYRELPMKIAELAQLYRYEKSGELSGLVRVRTFCLADAHIVAKPDQAEQQIDEVLDLIEYVAQSFGLEPKKNYRFRLSLGNRNDDKKYYKDDKAWDFAENVLRKVLDDRGTDYFEAEDEAAFYGPKIDLQMKNVLGKEETAFTVQYDFVMPKRFNLNYTDSDGVEKEAIVIHRSSIGAIERVMAFLIEHFGGAFPAWLSPEQVALIPISAETNSYANELKSELEELGVKVVSSDRDEMMQAKIRDAQEMKIPYMLILGKREQADRTISLRYRDRKENIVMKFDDFKEKINENIKLRKIDIHFE